MVYQIAQNTPFSFNNVSLKRWERIWNELYFGAGERASKAYMKDDHGREICAARPPRADQQPSLTFPPHIDNSIRQLPTFQNLPKIQFSFLFAISDNSPVNFNPPREVYRSISSRTILCFRSGRQVAFCPSIRGSAKVAPLTLLS